MEGKRLRKPIFKKMSAVEPQQRYNIVVQVIKVESTVTIKRVDADPLKMAICLVGDDTGCGRLLLKDAQVAFAKDGEMLTLRNVNSKIIKERIRLEVDIWGKVEKSSEVNNEILSLNRRNSLRSIRRTTSLRLSTRQLMNNHNPNLHNIEYVLI